MSFKILIVDALHHSHEELFSFPQAECIYKPYLSPEEVEKQIAPYQGLILRSKIKITEKFLQKAPQLRLIARAGAGLDEIDTEALAKHEITLLHAAEGNRDAVGEHTIGMMLTLLNKIHTADREVRNRIWQREENRGREIGGKTIGIVGYGNMGMSVAQKLQGFGATIIAYDRQEKPNPLAFVQQVSLEELQQRADIVSFHIPLNAQNRKLVDAHYLASFRKPIYLVNTSRGEIIDQYALLKALEMGKIAGACLDVLENEKFSQLSPDQESVLRPLTALPQVVFSPHVAGWTHESFERINEVLAQKIRAFLANFQV
jgi:D-3-phosphoglycerate dehydrogenase / 2-oxoglutarate reductase